MVIVPEETLDRLQQGSNNNNNNYAHASEVVAPSESKTAVELKSVQTPGDNLSRLDSEMYDILHSKKYKDEREKSQRYLQVLRRYLLFKEDERKNERGFDDVGDDDELVAGASTPLSDDSIVENMPKPLARKARELLRHLKNAAAGRLTWDNKGTVRIDGHGIKNSNISDLVNYAVKSTASRRGKRLLDDDGQLGDDDMPKGHWPFLNLVKSTQPSRELLGNNVSLVKTGKRRREEPAPNNQPFEAPITPIRTTKKARDNSVVPQTYQLEESRSSTPPITRSVVAGKKKKWLRFDLA